MTRTLALGSLLATTLLLGALPAHAAILTVDCGTGPFFDISSAVVAASPGDTIVIHPCTYPENVVIASKDSLHLTAAESPFLVGAEPTGVGSPPPTTMPVIDGTNSGPCLTVSNSSRVSITGLALTNCLGQGIGATNADLIKIHTNYLGGYSGAGIEIFNSGAPIITSNWIRQVSGNGIRLATVNSGVVADNTVEGIFGPGAAGIRVHAGTERSQVLRNEVRGNTGTGIQDAALMTRIERNTAEFNCTAGGFVPCGCSNILLRPASVDADVVGNRIAGAFDACIAVGWEAAENF